MSIYLFVNVLSCSLISAGLCSAFFWLIRTWISERLKESIKYEYELKLEAYKNELKNISEQNIENIKHQLNITYLEHQIKFSKLHEHRAHSIVDMNSMIQKLGETANSIVKCIKGTPTLEKPERLDTLNSMTNDFKLFYKLNKIYFRKAICDKIDNLCDECESILYKLMNGNHIKAEEINAELNTICGKIQKNIPDISSDLENDFRELLGV